MLGHNDAIMAKMLKINNIGFGVDLIKRGNHEPLQTGQYIQTKIRGRGRSQRPAHDR
jgi:hypothetical protein